METERNNGNDSVIFEISSKQRPDIENPHRLKKKEKDKENKKE